MREDTMTSCQKNAGRQAGRRAGGRAGRRAGGWASGHAVGRRSDAVHYKILAPEKATGKAPRTHFEEPVSEDRGEEASALLIMSRLGSRLRAHNPL